MGLRHLAASLLLGAAAVPAMAEDVHQPSAPGPRNSAKECALCHYRWVRDFEDGSGTVLAPYPAGKAVATSDMCLSCHDGSVVDSRARLADLRGHEIGAAPPDGVVLPEAFLLDEGGRVQCATCHTAHAVDDKKRAEETIFLRMSNRRSAMCRACHEGRNGGPEEGHHPLGKLGDVPESLRALGAKAGGGGDTLSCETCHTAHGSPFASLLVDRVDELCLHCHDDQLGHPVQVEPHEGQIPDDLLEDGAHLDPDGRVVCVSCHSVHDSPGASLLVRPEAELCGACHPEKSIVEGTTHDLSVSAPDEVNLDGLTVAEAGTCSACHLAHKPARAGASWTAGGATCMSCHDEGAFAESAALTGHMHPLGPIGEDGAEISCSSCHDAHDDAWPKYLRGDPEAVCGQCHDSALAVVGTLHDLRGDTEEETGFSLCGSCHVTHLGSSEWWTPETATRTRMTHLRTCESCHREGGSAAESPVRPGGHPLDELTCASCHDPHTWTTLQGELSEVADARTSFLRAPASPPDLCLECHEDQALVLQTDHDLVAYGSSAVNAEGRTPEESGTCGVCHASHGASEGPVLWARDMATEAGASRADGLCTDCHAPDGAAPRHVPEAAFHPADVLLTSRAASDGVREFPMFDPVSGSASDQGPLSCPSCHDAHRWDPASDQRGNGRDGNASDSFLRADSMALPCKDCHGTDSLYLYMYFHKATGRARPVGVNHE